MSGSNTRREFLGQAAGVAAGAAMMGVPSTVLAQTRSAMDQPADKKLNLLMLGGTGFLGPHIVWRAIERGHNVTLFNRGQTGPEMFPDLEHIQGDRYADLSGLESAIADGRNWDGAIDTFAYVPSVVTDMMNVIADAVGHYSLVSTISVYPNMDTPGANETAPLAEITDEMAAGIPTHREVGAHYGAMKARCERAGEAGMPGRIANVRAGLIVGSRDTTGRFTYWPVRATEGGTMIGPGSPSNPVQVIDVRDLANFIVLSIEKKLSGAYNAVSPAGKFTIGEVVDTSIKVADAGTEVEWIDADFLEAEGVQPWQHMPAWVSPTTEGYAGFGQMDCSKAMGAGMTIRSMKETVASTLEYYRTRGPELIAERGEEFGVQWHARVRGGLPAEREAEVLKAWFDRDNG
jgi:2'-hydroxyisoflavone reductase